MRIRSHGLYQNLASEVERALALRDFGPEVEALRKPLEPPRDVAVPEGLDLSLIRGPPRDPEPRRLGEAPGRLPLRARPADRRQAAKAAPGGSSWRVVVDVGEWDDSLLINSPGQSGDPASTHYSDLFRPWARDETVPLLYSKRKVEAAAERRVVLEPTGQ